MVDLPRREVFIDLPQQLEDGATLAAQAHSQFLATGKNRRQRAAWLSGGNRGLNGGSRGWSRRHIHAKRVAIESQLTAGR